MVALRDELLPEEVDVLARLGDEALELDAMLVVQNLYRAATAVRTRLESVALAPEDLSWAAFTMLFCLWVWGPLETRQLAAHMGVAKATVSGVTDTLERRALVERRALASDRRLRAIALTPAGERTFTALFPRFNRYEAAACAALTPAEAEELSRLLRKLVHSVRSGPDDDGERV
jgi:DNA-binding MarR family transcriptional regulator